MSSDRPVASPRSVPVPRTAVPIGISDPVEKARAELKAALFAIEEKANIPQRLGRDVERRVGAARRFARENPTGATAAVVGVALAVGTAVWAAVLSYTR